VVGTTADAAPEDVANAVAAARCAADGTTWAQDHDFRRHCLGQLQAGLRKEAARFREMAVAEAGIPSGNLDTHVDVMIEDMSYSSELIGRWPWERSFGAYELLGLRSDRRVRYEPYGVVGAITPWNAPFMTSIWKIGHSLATGNTVVLKSAPDTPIAAAIIAEVTLEHTDLPPGVLNTISSSDKAIAGEALTTDPLVDMFHFTGSPAVGQ